MTHTKFLVRVSNVGTSQLAAGLDMFDVADGVDLIDALEDACMEFFATPVGRKLVIDKHGSFTWSDLLEWVPEPVLAKHGVRKSVAPPGQVVVVHSDYPVVPGRQDIILSGDERDPH